MKTEEIRKRLNEQHTAIANAKNNLRDTDYIVIRAKEHGLTLTQEFKARRQGWRDEINACEAEIERLEAVKPEDEE